MTLRLPQITCDIVVPVFNGLTYVKECLASVLSSTRKSSYHLYIVDDRSDAYTHSFLRDFSDRHENATLLRNEVNAGFVKSCNRGIAAGSSPYVLLLNSDVIVTPGWLDRLVGCAESDARIGSVNPVTNSASQIDVPMPPGSNCFGIDLFLTEHDWGSDSKRAIDVVTGVGFCQMLRRSVVDELGAFDEIFGTGYCEDSDLCMRLTTNGWRTVVAPDVFVYHKRSATFADRSERYKANRKIFDRRWAREHTHQYKAFRKENPIGAVRDLFPRKFEWDPSIVLRQGTRAITERLRDRSLSGLSGAGREAMRGVYRLPRSRRELPSESMVTRLARPGSLRVTYLVPSLEVAEHVLSVVRIVNELVLNGVEARIATLIEDPAIYGVTKLLTRPMLFRSEKRLTGRLPETDIAVATTPTSARWVNELVAGGRTRGAVYFLQGYEAWISGTGGPGSYDETLRQLSRIRDKIVASEWLARRFRSAGFDAKTILSGLDLGVFYPRDTEDSSAPTVLAMSLPVTHGDNHSHVNEALRLVKESMPEVRIILMGDDRPAGARRRQSSTPFEFVNQATPIDQNRLAGIYSRSDVFLDGFGTPDMRTRALHAMACGAVCVMSDIDSVGEFARDGENCVLVSPTSPELLATNMLRVLRDKDRRASLSSAGRSTAAEYSHKREGRETAEHFQSIARKLSVTS